MFSAVVWILPLLSLFIIFYIKKKEKKKNLPRNANTALMLKAALGETNT